MLLENRKLVITGVLTSKSIATSVARLAIDQGADVVLTSFGRARRITERVAGKLPGSPDVIELDVTNPDHHAALAQELGSRWGRVDGALHAVGYAPENCLGSGMFTADWNDVATALEVSSYSLVSLARTLAPLMKPGAAMVALDFEASQAFPAYDWMGVAKAALESAARYLARDLGPAGIRVNLVSAGPLRTTAATSIPGFGQLEDAWASRAPLGWDTRDPEPAARACVALLSNWFGATTGEIVHVDGGFHAVAMAANEIVAE